MLDEFSRARLGQIDNALDIAPADLLRLLLDDIERGRLDPTGLLVVWTTAPAEGQFQVNTARAGLDRSAELVALEVSKRALMDRWVG